MIKIVALCLSVVLVMAGIPARADDVDRLAAGIAAYDTEDYGTAHALLQPLAEAGMPRALYLMGDMHWTGRGGVADFGAALDFLTRAADGAAAAEPQDGYTYREAVHRIGYLYRFGQGVPQNDEIAECLYRIGAEMGNPNSQWNLSRVIRDKPGIDPELLYWMERAATQGHPRALGAVGYGVSINPYEDSARGLMLMLIAAERGNKLAASRIAEAEALIADDVVEAFHRARLMKPNWRAVHEEPPARFEAQESACFDGLR